MGLALGYPPYQFASASGEARGIDAEVARLVFKELGMDYSFRQSSWDEVYLDLAHDTGDVDVLAGCEVNPERSALFDFSEPYYSRSVAIFVRAESAYRSLAELRYRPVAGDRDGMIERFVDREVFRVVATASKEESFRKLKSGEVDAVMAPLEVGSWISAQMGIRVRSLREKDPGSPVAFAVAKGNAALAARISAALKKLRASGQIDAVMKKYR